jgi:hypothetical protein
MLWKSKLSRAPSSERSSDSFSRASRSVRSRSTLTRSSQSTAFGPYVRMPMAISSSRWTSGVRHQAPRRQVLLNGVAQVWRPMMHQMAVAGSVPSLPSRCGVVAGKLIESPGPSRWVSKPTWIVRRPAST